MGSAQFMRRYKLLKGAFDFMAEITEMFRDFFTNAQINLTTLQEILSEFLAVEKGGQKLYQKALSLVSDAEVRAKFKEFHNQTVNHQKILTEIIAQLGGNPRAMSRTAKIATKKAQGLLSTMSRAGLSADEAELNAIENIVLAETKDHADWELIGKIARQTTDGRLREVLGAAARTVEDQEDQHLNWTRKKLGEMQMQALVNESAASKPARTRTKVNLNGNGARQKSAGKARTRKQKS
jgi:rubrerythrin